VKPIPRSVAAVIGIDHYSNGIPELRNARRDARELARTLAEHHGYKGPRRRGGGGRLHARRTCDQGRRIRQRRGHHR